MAVCHEAQEVSILRGRKKMQFLHIYVATCMWPLLKLEPISHIQEIAPAISKVWVAQVFFAIFSFYTLWKVAIKRDACTNQAETWHT